MLATAFAQPLQLRPLTGPYGVGHTTAVLTDSTRLETMSDDPHDLRRVVVEYWYPTDQPAATAPYIGDDPMLYDLAGLHLIGLEIAGTIDRDVRSHAMRDAPPAAAGDPWPVLLFSPGGGVPHHFYRGLIEDVVSDGYVVVSLQHPYFSGITVFAEENAAIGSVDFTDFADEWLDVLVADAGFAFASLARLEAGHALAGRLDLSGFGIYGHSLGGMVAIRAAREMPLCRAGLSLDGWSPDLGLRADDGSAPLGFLLSQEEQEGGIGVPPDSIYAQPDRFMAVFAGSAHIGFCDLPYLCADPRSATRQLGVVDPDALRAATNAITLDFFDRHLRGVRPDALPALGDRYRRGGATTTVAVAGGDSVVVEGLHLRPATAQRIALPLGADRTAVVKPVAGETRADSARSGPLAAVDALAGVSDTLADAGSSAPPAAAVPLQVPLVVRGAVRDAATGAALPGAAIQVKGTYDGTVAGDDGAYLLELKALPATLLVTHIGYGAAERVVADTAGVVADVDLNPSPLMMEPVVVTGENPADEIMRKVIANKPRLRRMDAYRARAYNRLNVENDTSIVAIREFVGDLYWDRERGVMSTVEAIRNTVNDELEQENWTWLGIWHVDLYGDYTRMIGIDGTSVQLVLPTHPEAFDHYNFALTGQRSLAGEVLYDIAFSPKKRVNSATSGTLSVLAGEFALVEIECATSPSVSAEYGLLFGVEAHDTSYRQQFRPFGPGVWLPVDYQVTARLKFGTFGLDIPRMTFKASARLRDYQIAPVIPDSIYARETGIDTLLAQRDSLFAPYPQTLVLDERERRAYAVLDSSYLGRNMFEATGIFASDFNAAQTQRGTAQAQGDTAAGDGGLRRRLGLKPRLWYNRVDGLHLGLAGEDTVGGRAQVHWHGGYHAALARWSWGGGARVGWGAGGRGSVGWRYHAGSRPRYGSDFYSRGHNSAPALVALGDYFDYYWSEGAALDLDYRLGRVALGLTARDERQSSLAKRTDFDLLGRGARLRPNPPVAAGRVRSLAGRVAYGGAFHPFARRPQRRVEWSFEYSSSRWLASDFDFARYELAADWHVDTFFRHKGQPNALYLRLVAGLATGDAPVRGAGVLDASMWGLTPFGTLRARRGRPYESERHVALFWEHDFRNAPFEMLGLSGLARRGVPLVLHGASARSWAAAGGAPDFYHELGVTLPLYGLVHLDLTRRLDERAWGVGVSLAPVFGR